MASSHILVLSCPDRPGIVHAVTGAILTGGGNFLESRQFDDRETGRFFLRMVIEAQDCDAIASAPSACAEYVRRNIRSAARAAADMANA